MKKILLLLFIATTIFGQLQKNVRVNDFYDSENNFYVVVPFQTGDTVMSFDSVGAGYFDYDRLGIGVDSAEANLHLKNSGLVTEEVGLTLEMGTEAYTIMLGNEYGGSASGLSIYNRNRMRTLTEFDKGETATDQSYVVMYSPDNTKMYIRIANDGTITASSTKP